MIEEFRDIKGYEGLYQVSNLGRVKSIGKKGVDGRNLKEKILKSSRQIYSSVTLHKEKKQSYKRVHQLVAVAFLGHIVNGYKGLIVDHINNIKADNRSENLELITARKNTSKDKTGGTSSYVGVSWNTQKRGWCSQIRVNGKNKYIGRFKTELEASNAYQKALHSL